jgi:hypothetical protein
MSNGTNSHESHADHGSVEDGSVDRLSHRAGTITVALAAAHVAYFLPSALEAAGDWIDGALWTLDLDAEMTGTDAAFWALPGGFAVPMGLLGLLIRRQARQGTPPPAYLGWGLGAWALLASVLTEPSGFPVGLIPAGMLVVAARRAAAVSTRRA